MIELKIKLPHQRFDRWEDLPVLTYLVDTEQHANDLAELIAQANNAFEVRWNFDRSSQGHYVYGPNRYPPDLSLRKRFGIDVSVTLFNSPADGLCLLIQKPSGSERIPIGPEDRLSPVAIGASE